MEDISSGRDDNTGGDQFKSGEEELNSGNDQVNTGPEVKSATTQREGKQILIEPS